MSEVPGLKFSDCGSRFLGAFEAAEDGISAVHAHGAPRAAPGLLSPERREEGESESA